MRLSLLITSLFCVLIAIPSISQAQPSQNSTSASVEDWQSRFVAARALLLAGDFSGALYAFQNLAGSAQTPQQAAMARELAGVAFHWQQGGYSLVKGESQAPAQVPNGLRKQGEMASLYTSAVFYGLGTGIAILPYTDPDSVAGFVLPSLALGGISAALVYSLDRNQTMRSGVPQSIIAGMTIGLTEGIAWTMWNQARVVSSDEWSEKAVLTLIWGGATAGAVTGGLIGQKFGSSPGRAAILGSASLWSGTIAGMLVGGVSNDSDRADDHAMLSAAIGLTGGAVGGYFLGEAENPSVARVRYVDLGGIAGGLIAGGLYISAANENTDGNDALLVSGLGITAGIVTGWLLTDGMEEEPTGEEVTWHPSLIPTQDGMLAGLQGTL